ncbi:MAG: alpha/beta hydrolase [Chloroflexi bacterium]|nr:alpha/beta hydrolase [Chloroflexota bacterium]
MPTLELDDLSLYYQERRQGNEPLLALHPSTVSGTLFQWALPKNGGFWVLLPDQRGHGETPNPAPDFHMPRLVNDMFNMLDALDIARVHGVGYSLGAAVLLNMASRDPERFESLILIATTHRPPTQDQLARIAGPAEHREGLVKKLMDDETGMMNGWDVSPPAIKQFDFPVSLIGGDRDPIGKLSDLVQLREWLPRGELLVVPSCGHFGFHSNPYVQQYLQSRYEEI